MRSGGMMRSKKGFVLILTFLAAVIVGIGVVAILQTISTFARMKSNTIQEAHERYLAEAGMQLAIYNCRNNLGLAAYLPPDGHDEPIGTAGTVNIMITTEDPNTHLRTITVTVR